MNVPNIIYIWETKKKRYHYLTSVGSAARVALVGLGGVQPYAEYEVESAMYLKENTSFDIDLRDKFVPAWAETCRPSKFLV